MEGILDWMVEVVMLLCMGLLAGYCGGLYVHYKHDVSKPDNPTFPSYEERRSESLQRFALMRALHGDPRYFNEKSKEWIIEPLGRYISKPAREGISWDVWLKQEGFIDERGEDGTQNG